MESARSAQESAVFADYAPTLSPGARGALIAQVDQGSPAEKGGLVAGMRVTSVEGVVPRDVLDWLWLASEGEVRLTAFSEPVAPLAPATSAAPPSAASHASAAPAPPPSASPPSAAPPSASASGAPEYLLTRTYGEGWGIAFADPLFDGLMTCKNSCVFCFMAMLPKGMRSSLYIRDDDYRLSFLQGNFVTLTNLSDEDVRRVIDYHLSPLHVSLHAVTSAARRQLMGKNHARGIEVLERLLAAGIEAHAQIVAVPNVNDGPELDETLAWVEKRPNVLSTGIVPYGFTQYARIRNTFSADEARHMIARLAPWQERSRARDGKTRFQLADEWYLLADAFSPPAEHYDGYPQFEDGIGMLRVFENECAQELPSFLSHGILVTGEAFAPTLRRLVAESFPQGASEPEVRAIQNRFFGGNVNVAGLLTAHDITTQLVEQGLPAAKTVMLPDVLFNADGLTLDDKRAEDIAQALNRRVIVVPCTIRI